MIATQTNTATKTAKRYIDRQALAASMPITGKVRANQCAAYLNIGLSTFWLYVSQGRIKKPIKFGARVSVWDADYIRDLASNGLPESVEG